MTAKPNDAKLMTMNDGAAKWRAQGKWDEVNDGEAKIVFEIIGISYS